MVTGRSGQPKGRQCGVVLEVTGCCFTSVLTSMPEEATVRLGRVTGQIGSSGAWYYSIPVVNLNQGNLVEGTELVWRDVGWGQGRS